MISSTFFTKLSKGSCFIIWRSTQTINLWKMAGKWWKKIIWVEYLYFFAWKLIWLCRLRPSSKFTSLFDVGFAGWRFVSLFDAGFANWHFLSLTLYWRFRDLWNNFPFSSPNLCWVQQMSTRCGNFGLNFGRKWNGFEKDWK